MLAQVSFRGGSQRPAADGAERGGDRDRHPQRGDRGRRRRQVRRGGGDAPARNGGARTEILSGLEAGQKVVASGQFLIDSEASLSGALARLTAPAPAAAAPAALAQGKVDEVDAAAGTIKLSHGPVASVGMPGMTMSFKVDPPALLRGIAVGQSVEFDLEKRGTRLRRDPARAQGRGAPSLSRRHDRQADPLVDPQPLPGAAGHPDRRRHGRGRGAAHAAGRPARPVRRAGDHPHALRRAESARGGGPGHLSPHHHHDVGARRQGRARLLVLRRFLRLCPVRGRHRPVLGALAGAGVPEPGAGPAAGERAPGTGAGRHRRRLDLRVRAGGSLRPPRPVAIADLAGLVPQVRTALRAQRGGGGDGGRHGQAVPGGGGSGPAARPQAAPGAGDGGDPQRQQRGGRLGPGTGRSGVHGARHRLPASRWRISAPFRSP